MADCTSPPTAAAACWRLAPKCFVAGRRFLDLVVFGFLDLVVGLGGPQDFFFLPQWHFLPVGRRFLDLVVFRFLNLVVGQGGPKDFFFFPLLQFFLGLPLRPLCPSGRQRRR